MAKKPTHEIETQSPLPPPTQAPTVDHGPGPYIEGALPRSDGYPTQEEVISLLSAQAPIAASELGSASGLHPVEIANGRSVVALYEGTASCSTCRFSALGDGGGLQCRRYPPARGSGDGFPGPLNSRTWCGEYSEGGRHA